MFLKTVLVICVVSIVLVNCADRNTPCMTPNNERAICRPVKQCTPIKNAVATRNAVALNFAKQSQCGYDTDPLVCCGSTGYPGSTLVFKHKYLPESNVCGLEKHDDRIFGGETTDIDEFPWTALLRYKDPADDFEFKCGGTLINERYVVTAAHCVLLNANTGISLIGVRLGEWRLSTQRDCLGQKGLEECSDPPLDLGIEKSTAHPYYSRKTRDHDIAIIRLERNVQFTDFVRPICLPKPEAPLPKIGSQLVLAGWGSTENSSNSDVKLKVKVPLVSPTECIKKLGKRGHISENQLCAGGLHQKDSCQGDSGGPIMQILEVASLSQYQWIQEGIISWGLGCGIKGIPGVYTRMSRYSKWIVDNMSDF